MVAKRTFRFGRNTCALFSQRSFLSVHSLLHPAKGGLAHQGVIFAHGGLKRLVKAQCLMIVQVFVSGCHTEHLLPGHGFQLVANQLWATWIIENRGQALSQTMLFVNFAQRKQSSTGGDVTAGEIGFNLAA